MSHPANDSLQDYVRDNFDKCFYVWDEKRDDVEEELQDLIAVVSKATEFYQIGGMTATQYDRYLAIALCDSAQKVRKIFPWR